MGFFIVSNCDRNILKSYSPFFWDIDINNLDTINHSIFIIERLLNKGNHHTLHWILNTYSSEEIKKLPVIGSTTLA